MACRVFPTRCVCCSSILWARSDARALARLYPPPRIYFRRGHNFHPRVRQRYSLYYIFILYFMHIYMYMHAWLLGCLVACLLASSADTHWQWKQMRNELECVKLSLGVLYVYKKKTSIDRFQWYQTEDRVVFINARHQREIELRKKNTNNDAATTA